MPIYAHDRLVQKLERSGLLDEFIVNFERLTQIKVSFREEKEMMGLQEYGDSHDVEILIKIGVVDLGYLVAKGPFSQKKANAVKSMLEMASKHIAQQLTQPMQGNEKVLPAVILAATETIRNNYDQPMRLSDLAAGLSISTERLSRLFKDSLGINYSDYLNEVRLDHCKKLLRHSTESISEIALKCGFQSLSQFNRRFRDSESISPRQYRNSYEFSEITIEQLL